MIFDRFNQCVRHLPGTHQRAADIGVSESEQTMLCAKQHTVIFRCIHKNLLRKCRFLEIEDEFADIVQQSGDE